MEIKSSNYAAPVSQNIKEELVNNSHEESDETNPVKLADDIVTLSSTSGGHPERPPKSN
jgi:hypothetical protein